jgi:hypothetical protein
MFDVPRLTPRGLCVRIRIALLLGAGVLAPCAAPALASWQGPGPLPVWNAYESPPQLTGFGAGAVALSWYDNMGRVMLAHRSQTESGLRQPLLLGELGMQGLGVGSMELQDGHALVVASLDTVDRTMVLAPDGSRGPLEDWPDGCAVTDVADSAYGTVAIASCADAEGAVTHSLARRPAGATAFGTLKPLPDGGPIPPTIEVAVVEPCRRHIPRRVAFDPYKD